MHYKFMERAIALSIENVDSGRGGPFGAVVVKDGVIIAEGVNLVTATNDPTAHAEITAIRAACKQLSSFQLTDCTVYSSCEPCPMCLGALYWARPDAVYYANTRADAAAIGFDDSLIYDELALPDAQKTLVIKKIEHPDASIAFDRWLRVFHINY